jgi:photosystem II stability/assembly factor-like uncharacterized protein
MSKTAQRLSPSWRQPAVAILTVALGAVPPLAAGTDVWTAVGPNGGQAFTVLVDAASPQVVYAGTAGGVFKSTTGGAAWQAAGRGMTVDTVTALAIDPAHHETVFATAGNVWTAASGIWASRDGAATWETVLLVDNSQGHAGRGNEYLSSLAVDPAHPGAVYAASNFHLFVSRDGGQTWKVGMDFLAVDSQAGLIVKLAADPDRASVFALVAAGPFTRQPYFKLFESADGGLHWLDRSAALPDGATFQISNLAIEPTAPGTLFLAGTAVFRSTDGAASWRRASPGWQRAGIGPAPLAAGPRGLVVAGNTDDPAVFMSRDGGATWAAIATPPADSVASFALSASPRQIFAAVSTLGVVASGDGGATWQAANSGLRAMPALAVAIDPQDSSVLFTAGNADGALGLSGLSRSRNAGGRWIAIGPHEPESTLWVAFTSSGSYYFNPNSLLVDPAQPGQLYYATGNQAVASADAGATWVPVTPPEDCQSLFFLGLAHSTPATLYSTASVCPSGCSAFKSLDGGASWACLNLPGAHRIVTAPSDPNVLYAVSWIFGETPPQHLLWRSTDAGATWAPIDSSLALAATPLLDEPNLAVDPADAQRIFVSVPQGVWLSVDAGATWTERDHGLPHGAPGPAFPFSPLLAVDPNDSSLVYAAAADIGSTAAATAATTGNRSSPACHLSIR